MELKLRDYDLDKIRDLLNNHPTTKDYDQQWLCTAFHESEEYFFNWSGADDNDSPELRIAKGKISYFDIDGKEGIPYQLLKPLHNILKQNTREYIWVITSLNGDRGEIGRVLKTEKEAYKMLNMMNEDDEYDMQYTVTKKEIFEFKKGDY